MMDTQKYVGGLFSSYEETPDIADFKEELRSNLDDKVASLIKKGMTEEQAFAKATTELGDISALADDISLKKKKEVFSEMYMKTKSYMKMWQKIGYTIAFGLMAVGIVLAFATYSATNELRVVIASLIPFFIVPACGFVFLGLTQETAKNYPMNRKRAIFYAADVAVILFGLIVFAFMFFEGAENVAIIGTLIPFFLPGIVILAYLLLTEKSRNKPWVVEQQTIFAEHMKEQFADPYAATRFGLFSGALWIFAVALFVILGYIIGFQYSWVVFVLSVAGQVFLQALMTPKTRSRN